MRHVRLNIKAIILASIFSVAVVGMALFINKIYTDWAKEIIQTNKVLCEVVARQLQGASQEKIDSLNTAAYFTNGYKNNVVSNKVDELLSRISSNSFKNVTGIEGGFFISALNKFQGYAYPTSPPPIPAYGPPPRSFNIIRKQIIKSLEHDSVIVGMHQFDPAIFPLATIPIKVKGKIVGAVWTRTHIERELPELSWANVLNIAGIISVLGFIFAVTISIRLRNSLEKLCTDLELFEKDSTHRLKSPPGMFGFINSSINKMLNALQVEHQKREILELELHQQDKMASLGKLVPDVAHEVKTPLAIIKTRIQMWQQKLNQKKDGSAAEDGITNDSLQMVINEVNRLTDLVNKLLIFSKPVNENFIAVDINELVNDILTLFRTKRYVSKAKINFEPSDNLPMVQSNPNKIEQVLLNIITNSFESITKDGKIDIKTSSENGFVKLSITDNGHGIPEEVVGNIFDPFFTTKESGTGLGLSIAYEIIQTQEGKIEFTSEEGKGSTFVVTLPIQKKSIVYES